MVNYANKIIRKNGRRLREKKLLNIITLHTHSFFYFNNYTELYSIV